jgi:hypothetical protein
MLRDLIRVTVLLPGIPAHHERPARNPHYLQGDVAGKKDGRFPLRLPLLFDDTLGLALTFALGHPFDNPFGLTFDRAFRLAFDNALGSTFAFGLAFNDAFRLTLDYSFPLAFRAAR